MERRGSHSPATAPYLCLKCFVFCLRRFHFTLRLSSCSEAGSLWMNLTLFPFQNAPLLIFVSWLFILWVCTSRLIYSLCKTAWYQTVHFQWLILERLAELASFRSICEDEPRTSSSVGRLVFRGPRGVLLRKGPSVSVRFFACRVSFSWWASFSFCCSVTISNTVNSLFYLSVCFVGRFGKLAVVSWKIFDTVISFSLFRYFDPIYDFYATGKLHVPKVRLFQIWIFLKIERCHLYGKAEYRQWSGNASGAVFYKFIECVL